MAQFKPDVRIPYRSFSEMRCRVGNLLLDVLNRYGCREVSVNTIRQEVIDTKTIKPITHSHQVVSYSRVSVKPMLAQILL